jgi:hypothetical protein
MPFTSDDRTAVTDLINRHGHLTDAGELDRMDEVFTPDVVYDVSDLGIPGLDDGVLTGLATLRAATLAVGQANPVAHHITNIVISETGDDLVNAVSKGLGVSTDGTVGSVTYEDTVARTGAGWRIRRRTVRARRVPLER